ncbi:farnesyl pyrophosphate synthase-like [Symsagittifera roscoffensis]|uniref:farnesyl pyrophosphate synthase-like n=1 Tax=Symsagittifera roscoffensis TaxID=84072 RepID=UPI00307B19E9
MAEMTKEDFRKRYESVLESVLSCDVLSTDTRLSDVLERLRSLLDYTVPDGKLNRGLAVVQTYQLIENSRTDINDDEKQALKEQAIYVGWAVEIMQAFFLIADDMMDHSETRRGKPCWYKVPSVDLDAINDTFFLEQIVYKLIKAKCHKLPCYPKIVDLFHDIVYRTTIGQTMDLVTAPVGKPNLDKFSEERYLSIATYKTAYYSIYLPIVCAVLLTGLDSEKLLKKIEEISIGLGVYFQIQDDFLDLYGDPAVTGKIGTDIQDNKCSWLVVQALKHCSNKQRDILNENYGYFDDLKIEKVKEVFEQLDLKSRFREYEDSSYHKLMENISKLENDGVKNAFEVLIAKLYKRCK